MIVNISNPKKFTREHLQEIKHFSKMAGYKINSNKSVAVLYTMINGLREKLWKHWAVVVHAIIPST